MAYARYAVTFASHANPANGSQALPELVLAFNPGSAALPYTAAAVCSKGASTGVCGGAADSAGGGVYGGFCNATALAGSSSSSSGSWTGGLCPLVPAVAGAGNYSYTLTGLTPGVTVYARVAAQSTASAGFGPASAAVSTTPRAVPDAPPAATAAPGGGATALYIAWAAPLNVHGAPLLNYSLRYYTDPAFPPAATVQLSAAVESFLNTAATDATTPSTLLTNLAPGVPLHVAVAGVNAEGTGGWALVEGSPVTPMARPAAIAAEDVALAVLPADALVSTGDSATSLLLTWRAPPSASGSPIASFLVEWWPADLPGRAETQNLTVVSASGAGAFVLSYGGASTTPLPVGAPPAAVAAALQQLPPFAAVEVYAYPGASPAATSYMLNFLHLPAGELPLPLLVTCSASCSAAVEGGLNTPMGGASWSIAAGATYATSPTDVSALLTAGSYVSFRATGPPTPASPSDNAAIRRVMAVTYDAAAATCTVTLDSAWTGASFAGSAYLFSGATVPGAASARYASATVERQRCCCHQH